MPNIKLKNIETEVIFLYGTYTYWVVLLKLNNAYHKSGSDTEQNTFVWADRKHTKDLPGKINGSVFTSNTIKSNSFLCSHSTAPSLTLNSYWFLVCIERPPIVSNKVCFPFTEVKFAHNATVMASVGLFRNVFPSS